MVDAIPYLTLETNCDVSHIAYTKEFLYFLTIDGLFLIFQLLLDPLPAVTHIREIKIPSNTHISMFNYPYFMISTVYNMVCCYKFQNKDVDEVFKETARDIVTSISLSYDNLYYSVNNDKCIYSYDLKNEITDFVDISDFITDNGFNCKFSAASPTHFLLINNSDAYLISKSNRKEYWKSNIQFSIKQIDSVELEEFYYIIVGWAGDIAFLSENHYYQIKTHLIIQDIQVIKYKDSEIYLVIFSSDLQLLILNNLLELIPS